MPVTILHIQVAEKRASFPVLILILRAAAPCVTISHMHVMSVDRE
jgi:hypothetical protein